MSQKRKFSFLFWKVLLIVSVIVSCGYFIYSLIPDAPIVHKLSFLAYSRENTDPAWVAFLLFITNLPLFFLLHQLSKGKYRQLINKKK